MGSAAAWQLANAGQEVILIERQSSTYTSGSSFGESRICRSLGPKHDTWSYLHRRALVETENLTSFLNSKDSAPHKMEDVYTTSPVTYLLNTDKKAVVNRMLRQQQDEYKSANNPEDGLKLFDVNLSESQIVIQEYRKHSGTINPKVLISKMHLAIELKGSKILYEKKVKSIKKIARQSETGYEIEITDHVSGQKENLIAKKVVCAAGPYLATLLRDANSEIVRLITPKRVPLSFFKIVPSKYQTYSAKQKEKIIKFFPLIDVGPSYHFSMIEKMDEHGIPLIKSGGHFQRSAIEDLDTVWQKEVTQEEITWTKEHLLAYFKFINIPLRSDELIYDHGYSCVYSVTENEVPLLDYLPDHEGNPDPNFVMVGGMSGVGAKGAMAYGKMAANLLLGVNEDDFMYRKTLGKLSFEGRKVSS